MAESFTKLTKPTAAICWFVLTKFSQNDVSAGFPLRVSENDPKRNLQLFDNQRMLSPCLLLQRRLRLCETDVFLKC